MCSQSFCTTSGGTKLATDEINTILGLHFFEYEFPANYRNRIIVLQE